MVFRKYAFRPYSKDFPNWFRREKAGLKKVLPSDAIIAHVGSTAVPGLGGKGIIDILVSVKKPRLKEARRLLESQGFVFKRKAGSAQRLFFQKDQVLFGKLQRFHVHLTFHDSLTFRRTLALAEFLKARPKFRIEYAALKKKAVKLAKEDGKKYRAVKKEFLENLTNEALTGFG